MFPTCLFDALPSWFQARSAPGSLLPPSLLKEGSSSPAARCLKVQLGIRYLSSNFAPLRGFLSPRDRRWFDCQSRSLLSRNARSSFAPRRRFFKITYGSSFRIRYASLSSLFRKPLGTVTIVLQNPFTVKKNVRFAGEFPGTLFCLISTA
jgi:hypothetical protein